jgi:pyruvate dehydrogenase kinase 2/3/4
MLFELFKNAMRAVMEYHSHDDVIEIPKLKVIVVRGKEDICVKVSDRGGGIGRSQADQLFKYMYRYLKGEASIIKNHYYIKIMSSC